ncbi:MAG TPA: ABC transporter permease, partial [Blastocatellia bacterium]|nr:ABC transporter permease [Blastocatellia bacterium]
ALGARRIQIIRQLLTESLLLSIIGGALGLVFALWCRDLLIGFSPGNIPRLDEISLDGRVLGFTVGITLLTTLLFGLVPALQASKPDLTTALKESGQKGGGTFQGRRLRSALVVAEIALSLVLVISAGLMIRSFLKLQKVDPGFKADNLLTMRISLPGIRYPEDSNARTFFEQAQERIKNLPGVVSVGATTTPPLKGYRWTGDMTIEGRSPEDYAREIRHKEITNDYFRAIGIPLVSGRFFDQSDNDKGLQSVVVNEALARQYFSGEDPIGKRVKFGKPESNSPWEVIVGVVGNEKQDSLGKDVKPEVYKSHLQDAQSEMTLVMRTAVDPRSLVDAVRSEIRAMDKDLPPFDIKTMNDLLYTSVARERFTMLLLAIFAGLALVLAGIGIYGVINYSVARRTREIGIRMALGADSKAVLRLVVGQGLKLAVAGVAIGIFAALALTRLMSSLLFGVSAIDPLTFTGVSLILITVAVVACSIPARRATKVDPMEALRYE